MSTPENPLAKYRSYSYHHILIACDNDAAASYIRDGQDLSVFRELGEEQELGVDEDDSKKLKLIDRRNKATGDVEATRIGGYVVILNGMIDTTFVIRDAEWFTATAASTDRNDRFTSIAVEGKITVEEPRGVRFMNALNNACDKLKTDPSGVIWMLKTVFIGHTDDERPEPIVDLRPLEFMIYDVTGTFDNTGGTYEISFAGASNGAARFPQFSRVSQNISFTPEPPGYLEPAMNQLAKAMTDASISNRKCVIEALKKAYKNLDSKELEELRQVNYQIIMEAPYTNEEYVIDGLTELEKDKATSAATGVLKFGLQSTVEQAIRHIMDRSSRVKKDLTEGDEKGTKYSWKIHSEITMLGKDTPEPLQSQQTDESVVAVVYRVRQHAEMTNTTVEDALSIGSDGQPTAKSIAGDKEEKDTQQKIKENLITFNYFFTGKNTDIIDFDLKMEMGLAFMQTLSSSNTINTGANQIGGIYPENTRTIIPTENRTGNPNVSSIDDSNSQPASDQTKDTPQTLRRSRTPIFPATNTNNVLTKNITDAQNTTLFSALLERHAALESVEAMITIHGNPFLMSQLNRRINERDRKVNVSNEDPETQDESRIIQNWDSLPALAKVNIYMPGSSDTPSSQDSFIKQKFWYDGYYYIYGIDHKFDSGQFTQKLHMMSLPNQSELRQAKESEISECGIEEEAPSKKETLEEIVVTVTKRSLDDFDTLKPPAVGNTGKVTPEPAPPVPTCKGVVQAAGSKR